MPDTKSRTWRKIGCFYAFTLLFTGFFSLFAIRVVGLDAGNLLYYTGLMWSPALAAFLTKWLFGESLRSLPWGLGPARYAWLGYFIPVAYILPVYLFAWLTGLGGFADTATLPADLLLIYTSRNDDFRKLPNICSFISKFREKITCKEVKDGKHPLFALHRPREEDIFLKPKKYLGVITGDRIQIAVDEQQLFATDGLFLFGVRPEIDGHFVMGLLNSRLFVFLYRLLAMESGRVLAQVKPTIVGQLPIRTLDLTKPDEKKQHDRMVQLVEAMLSTQQQLAAVENENDRAYYESKAAGLDRQIDEITFDLYGLTAEERALVAAG